MSLGTARRRTCLVPPKVPTKAKKQNPFSVDLITVLTARDSDSRVLLILYFVLRIKKQPFIIIACSVYASRVNMHVGSTSAARLTLQQPSLVALLRIQHVHSPKDLLLRLLERVPSTEVDLSIGRVVRRIALDGSAASVGIPRLPVGVEGLEPHADEVETSTLEELAELEERE